MSMDRLRRVRDLWSWLPAFRAVAETEHLPTAAEALLVSPSALSRSVSLVEEDLGVALFTREGRGMRLTAEGERFLARVRDAMRLVHEGIEEVTGARVAGPVRVSAAGAAVVPLVVPVIAELLDAWPDATLELTTVAPERVADALVRGDLDVAFQSVPNDDPRVHTEPLAELANSVWCGPGHPLRDRRRVRRDDLAQHAFAAPPRDERGRTWDGWPVTWPRRVRARVGTMQAGVALAETGRVLAFLPDLLAERSPLLQRVPVSGLPTTPLLAIRRPPVGERPPAERIVEAVRARMSGVG